MEDARDITGRTVLLKLIDQEELEFAGISEEGPFFCKVTAIDQFGVWVENRKFVTIEIRDSKGRYIPKAKQKSERHLVNLLFPWRNIQTIIRFSEKDVEKIAGEAIGETEKKTGRIGFIT